MKKLLLGFLALVLGVTAIDSLDSTSQPATAIESSVSRPLNVTTQVEEKTKPIVSDEDVKEVYKRSIQNDDSKLSNDNYYININGNKVPSPTYSEDGNVPAGASAQCRDGTYSFSENRRGTCSGHGGVASWL